MPYEEEEDRGCEVKCPKGGGVCSRGATKGHVSNSYIIALFLKSGRANGVAPT